MASARFLSSRQDKYATRLEAEQVVPVAQPQQHAIPVAGDAGGAVGTNEDHAPAVVDATSMPAAHEAHQPAGADRTRIHCRRCGRRREQHPDRKVLHRTMLF